MPTTLSFSSCGGAAADDPAQCNLPRRRGIAPPGFLSRPYPMFAPRRFGIYLNAAPPRGFNHS